MNEAMSVAESTPSLEGDALRAQFYGLLANFLSSPPTDELLAAAAGMTGDETPLGKAVTAFATACGRCDAGAADNEFHALFIGVGRGELLPFGSYYLTGFLHEKPLARLRADMSALGIERPDGVSEPEDHAASVLEIMSGLIDGRFGEPASLARQKKFYDAHVGSWIQLFFQDLERASSSELYAALAVVAKCFLDVEREAFGFVEEGTANG